jgi:hypothetical protein
VVAVARRKTKIEEKQIEAKKQNTVFFCPLFEHYKQVDVCTYLRAKRLCKFQCQQYFKWSRENKEQIEKSVAEHQVKVLDYLHKKGDLTHDDLMKNIMPEGDYICEHCGRAYKTERKLQLHAKRKHKRLLL